jgi:hypothetical protein
VKLSLVYREKLLSEPDTPEAAQRFVEMLPMPSALQWRNLKNENMLEASILVAKMHFFRRLSSLGLRITQSSVLPPWPKKASKSLLAFSGSCTIEDLQLAQEGGLWAYDLDHATCILSQIPINSSIEFIENLMKLGVRPTCFLADTPPLYRFIVAHRSDAVRVILQNLDSHDIQNVWNEAVFWASKYDDDTLFALLDENVSCTQLLQVITAGHPAVIDRVLTQCQAEFNQIPFDFHPFLMAVSTSPIEQVRRMSFLLVSHPCKQVILDVAVSRAIREAHAREVRGAGSRTEVVDYLLSIGAKISFDHSIGFILGPLLAVASRNGSVEMFDRVIEARINVTETFYESHLGFETNAFIEACRSGHLPLLKHIMHYFKEDGMNTKDTTALIEAAKAGQDSVVYWLLMWRKSDVNEADHRGCSAVDYAELGGFSTFLNCLPDFLPIGPPAELFDKREPINPSSQQVS